MTYGEYVLLFLLFLMMLSDLYSDQIPNGMIPLEIAAGLFCSFRQQGLWGVLYALLSMTAAFLLTYFLFKLGALGAGDVKVFLVVGSFVPIRECLVIVAVSFGIGANEVFCVLYDGCRKKRQMEALWRTSERGSPKIS